MAPLPAFGIDPGFGFSQGKGGAAPALAAFGLTSQWGKQTDRQSCFQNRLKLSLEADPDGAAEEEPRGGQPRDSLSCSEEPPTLRLYVRAFVPLRL